VSDATAPPTPIRSVLVANRGEIARRVIRTARAMGIRTVAVFVEADAAAPFVREADHAVRLERGYLDGPAVVAAARRSGADAIHPGYGFLSENAGFAQAVIDAGLVWVGPSPDVIASMGDKLNAKAAAVAAGVPTLPSTEDPAAADEVGYPLLVKASAGGGGKGMRIVERAEDLDDAVAAARREAASSFGDDRVFLERYVARSRHVEIQILGDDHGTVVHLGERECSIQRRHQKIIEEAPSAALSDASRAELLATAVKATAAIGYRSLGTLEFLYDQDGRFYFMEMNTRLQVEHPVTEMISGLDLVEWQLRVAAGEALPWRQESLSPRGHAIEARLYAEDPARDFLPASGRLLRLRAPPEDGVHARVDTGVREGDEVGIHYDPMIAKLIVWDDTRETALRRLRGALAAYELAGLPTNLAFLTRVAAHPEFAAGAIDTGFIARHRDALVPEPTPTPGEIVATAALALLLEQDEAARGAAAASGDPWSPWHRRNGWRLNGETYQDLRFDDATGEEHAVRVHYRNGGYALDLSDDRIAARAERTDEGGLVVELDGVRSRFAALHQGRDVIVLQNGTSWRLRHLDPLAPELEEDAGGGRLTAPMPGRVLEVLVADGTRVARGQALMVLEAMKMEHTIAAPADGVVARVSYAAGDLVEEGAMLLAFEEGNDAAA
jgi:3-methylcrotonyl-CoA carboxylase alpha subunit